ncbi:class II aldolase/adducin family protein [Kribbella sp. NPDC000426]|uniref:class II aldolase/adducin family protein n=1 Tax=Kribbella sp. NPDC000426 TaxID=3154255 RepID=UPI0033315757
MAGVGQAVEELRRSAADAFLFTTGVVSIRRADRLVIKPSGVSVEGLSTDSVVLTDLSGEVLEGVLAPSDAGDAHACVYREMPGVGSVVNTRSTLSLAWAARGEQIPHVPTIADGFDGPIPVGPYVSDRGRGIVDTLAATSSPAVLMPGQGLFTTGPNPAETFRAAVVLEQLIRFVHIGRHLGTAEPVDPHELDRLLRST